MRYRDPSHALVQVGGAVRGFPGCSRGRIVAFHQLSPRRRLLRVAESGAYHATRHDGRVAMSLSGCGGATAEALDPGGIRSAPTGCQLDGTDRQSIRPHRRHSSAPRIASSAPSRADPVVRPSGTIVRLVLFSGPATPGNGLYGLWPAPRPGNPDRRNPWCDLDTLARPSRALGHPCPALGHPRAPSSDHRTPSSDHRTPSLDAFRPSGIVARAFGAHASTVVRPSGTIVRSVAWWGAEKGGPRVGGRGHDRRRALRAAPSCGHAAGDRRRPREGGGDVKGGCDAAGHDHPDVAAAGAEAAAAGGAAGRGVPDGDAGGGSAAASEARCAAYVESLIRRKLPPAMRRRVWGFVMRISCQCAICQTCYCRHADHLAPSPDPRTPPSAPRTPCVWVPGRALWLRGS